MGRGAGVIELMAGVAVAAVVLAALRANSVAGVVLLAFLPITALRARAFLRADCAAGRAATPGRVARAWGESVGRVLAAFGVGLLLAVLLIALVGAGFNLVVQALRPGLNAAAVGSYLLVWLVLAWCGLGLFGWVASRLLQETWPGTGPPAAGENRAKMGDVDREEGPRAVRSGPAPGGHPAGR